MTNGNMYTPPQADLDVPLGEAPDELATRKERFAAAMIDGIIAMTVASPLMYYFWKAGAYSSSEIPFDVMLISHVFGVTTSLILNGYFWHKFGQSIGKKMIGIRIVDLQGNKPPLWKIFIVRFWLFSTPSLAGTPWNYLGVIDVLAIFTKNRRCVHDYVAGTKVVSCKAMPIA